MNLRTNIFFTLSLIVACQVSAQSKRFQYYFDKDLNSTSVAKALFEGIGTREGGLIKMECYTKLSKKLIMTAHYTDSTLSTYQGSFESYYLNGKMETQGYFVDNKESGLWKMWDSLGRVTDSIIYNKGKKLSSVSYTYNENNSIGSRIIEDNNTDKLQKFFYDEKGKLIGEHLFTGQDGIIKNYGDSGVTSRTVNTREEIEASFPGGPPAWNEFIKNIFVKNIDALSKDGKTGTCIVKFTINKDGKIIDPVATTMQGTLLAEIVIRAFKRAPKWNPAKQYGRFVNAYRIQPVSFNLTSD